MPRWLCIDSTGRAGERSGAPYEMFYGDPVGRDDDLAEMDADTRKNIERDRARWTAVVALSRARFAVDDLVGMTVGQARAVVEAAGGEFVTDDGPLAMKLDPNRLVASVIAGLVVDTRIG